MRPPSLPSTGVSSEPRTQLAQEAYLFTLTNEPSRAPQRHVLSKREAGWRWQIVMQACKAKGDAHSAQQQTNCLPRHRCAFIDISQKRY